MDSRKFSEKRRDADNPTGARRHCKDFMRTARSETLYFIVGVYHYGYQSCHFLGYSIYK